MYFQNYRLSKTWLDHSLKGAVSEHPSTVNMLKGPKHLRNLQESIFIIFSITLKGKDLENISLIEMQGVNGVCQRIDSRLLVSSEKL